MRHASPPCTSALQPDANPTGLMTGSAPCLRIRVRQTGSGCHAIYPACLTDPTIPHAANSHSPAMTHWSRSNLAWREIDSPRPWCRLCPYFYPGPAPSPALGSFEAHRSGSAPRRHAKVEVIKRVCVESNFCVHAHGDCEECLRLGLCPGNQPVLGSTIPYRRAVRPAETARRRLRKKRGRRMTAPDGR